MYLEVGLYRITLGLCGMIVVLLT
ncbi:hypothetical protein Goari_014407 [Gossypium aridum]|uniref:Uncharacterized protein n=1 Tax=Gossypium aridum TaxID=34290 RepID=A0A7J8XID6_GOSAI|nr:hypothetical protein [Gossypium aridum]